MQLPIHSPFKQSAEASLPDVPAAVAPRRSWTNWTKLSIDVYARLVDAPRHLRLRLKQTAALLPLVKLKSVVDVYPGRRVPVAMHLDVKLFHFFKYRLHQDGRAYVLLRASAPMADPRLVVDVQYARDLRSAVGSVKVALRVMDVAFFKAPALAFGFSYPSRLANRLKITLRSKKYLPVAAQGKGDAKNTRTQRSQRNPKPPHHLPSASFLHKLLSGIHGPSSVDLKLRCLEYR